MNLPQDIIRIILIYVDLATLKSYFCTYIEAFNVTNNYFWQCKIQYDSLDFMQTNILTYEEYTKLYQSKYEINKIFDIMQEEYLDYIKTEKRFELNGKISADIENLSEQYNIKQSEDILTTIFDQLFEFKQNKYDNYTNFKLNLNTIIGSDIAVRLYIIVSNYGDSSYITSSITLVNKKIKDIIELKITLCKLYYYFPSIDLRGAFTGYTRIPLFKHHLENYIGEGLWHSNRRPFYRRLELINNYVK